MGGNRLTTAYAFNNNLVRSTLSDLIMCAYTGGSISIGNYALFGGRRT